MIFHINSYLISDVLPGESRDITKKKKTKVRKLTNDELFYDPNMDEDDERWVQRQRLAYHNGGYYLHGYESH